MVLGLCSFVVRAVILISFLRGINPLVFGNIKWIHACLCSQPICMTYSWFKFCVNRLRLFRVTVAQGFFKGFAKDAVDLILLKWSDIC